MEEFCRLFRGVDLHGRSVYLFVVKTQGKCLDYEAYEVYEGFKGVACDLDHGEPNWHDLA